MQCQHWVQCQKANPGLWFVSPKYLDSESIFPVSDYTCAQGVAKRSFSTKGGSRGDPNLILQYINTTNNHFFSIRFSEYFSDLRMSEFMYSVPDNFKNSY